MFLFLYTMTVEVQGSCKANRLFIMFWEVDSFEY